MATPLFGLPDIPPNSPTAYAWLNFTARVHESVGLRRVILDTSLTAPPGSPAEGDLYFVAATATGAWAGHDEELAVYVEGAWAFLPIFAGMQFWIAAGGSLMYWDGAAWV